MSVASALSTFQAAVAQADSLIANTHRLDSDGTPVLPPLDQQQVTAAAFLNVYIAWETFLEAVISSLLSGEPTITGRLVTKYASPLNPDRAKKMLIGISKHFDYANHQNITKVAEIFFENGEPFKPHINAIHSILDDLRVMRNASAHVSSTTQLSLESLALRLLGAPSPGIRLYDLLTATNQSGSTIFEHYKQHLLVTASLIAHG